MTSSIFGNTGMNDMGSAVRGVVAAMRGDPEGYAKRLMAENPAFAQFVQSNRCKSPQQIAAEMGVDYNRLAAMVGCR